MRSKEEEKGRDVKIGRKNCFFKAGRNGGFPEGRKKEEEEGEECHFTIWNACIQIEGGSFAPRRMRLYLHCHTPTPPCLDNGKRHPGKSHCGAAELHKSSRAMDIVAR